jgi:glycosyltransferase involved in cell wall biosynthesis
MSHIAIDARIINSTSGRYVERLLTYLEQVDKTNVYTILVPTKDLSYWEPTNPNFTVIAADFANYSVAEQIGLRTLLKKIKPDLVHFCMPQQPVFLGIPHVTTFHDFTLVKTYNSDKNWLVFHAKQLIGKWVFKHVARTSEKIIVISEYTKKELLAFTGVPEEKAVLTYESAEVRTTASRPYQSPFKQYILYVGQQSDYKNIKRLGDAHQKLLSANPELGLILVGKLNDSAKNNKTYFESKDYKNILFTDFIEDDQLNWLYDHAAAYVFPSLMEGFGLPGLEVMTHGTPLVSSNATCLPEIYGEAAKYFDPLNVDDMARAINEVLSNESLRLELVKNGYNQVKKYSWKTMAEQTNQVYLDALKAKN